MLWGIRIQSLLWDHIMLEDMRRVDRMVPPGSRAESKAQYSQSSTSQTCPISISGTYQEPVLLAILVLSTKNHPALLAAFYTDRVEQCWKRIKWFTFFKLPVWVTGSHYNISVVMCVLFFQDRWHLVPNK